MPTVAERPSHAIKVATYRRHYYAGIARDIGMTVDDFVNILP